MGIPESSPASVPALPQSRHAYGHNAQLSEHSIPPTSGRLITVRPYSCGGSSTH